MEQMTKKLSRVSGILVHPTSFPSPYGIGDLGSSAYEFIDFLKSSGQTLWQCLPLGPTGFGDSPYQPFSAFAGQPLIISPEKLIEDGLLTEEDCRTDLVWDPVLVDYSSVQAYKTSLFQKAYAHFKQQTSKSLLSDFNEFCIENDGWLLNYALFMALKDANDKKCWMEWPAVYKSPTKKTLIQVQQTFADEIDYYRFIQFLFFKQWKELHDYAANAGVKIIGDIPIFVSPDSADVWANKSLFQLDSKGYPTVVAGVPPDYFSETGQLWGNPLYKWPAHKKQHYAWWLQRIEHQLQMTDLLRIDHFRGLDEYWSIPYGEETAINGKWVKGPGHDFLDAITEKFGDHPPIIAEDLGIITPTVEALRDDYQLPGMRILQFAFDDVNDNIHLPYRHIENCICYTGTHDNDTTVGWYQQASEASKDKVRRYLSCDGSAIHWDFIRLALSSVAAYAIFPIQDLFGLDSTARMNIPGSMMNNWAWRYLPEYLNEGTAKYLKELCKLYYRNQEEEL